MAPLVPPGYAYVTVTILPWLASGSFILLCLHT